MRWVVLGCLITGSLAFGKSAPSFTGDKLGGGKASLKEGLKDGRALLVSFWASWCTPCLEELRHVSDRLKAEPKLPLDVLTVNVDTSETASDVRPTIRLHKFTFPVVLDPKHEIFSKYQESKTLPYSVLVNSKGEIVATFNGFHEGMFAKVKELVGAPAADAAPVKDKAAAPAASEKTEKGKARSGEKR